MLPGAMLPERTASSSASGMDAPGHLTTSRCLIRRWVGARRAAGPDAAGAHGLVQRERDGRAGTHNDL